MDKVDEDYFKEMVEAATSGEGGKRSNDVSIKDDGTTVEDIQVSSSLQMTAAGRGMVTSCCSHQLSLTEVCTRKMFRLTCSH